MNIDTYTLQDEGSSNYRPATADHRLQAHRLHSAEATGGYRQEDAEHTGKAATDEGPWLTGQADMAQTDIGASVYTPAAIGPRLLATGHKLRAAGYRPVACRL